MGSATCDAGKIATLVGACQVMLATVLREFATFKEWEGKKGGYFCVADGLSGTPLLVALVGEVPLEKVEKYLEFSQEKSRRLAFQIGHLSSWESRDPSHNQWGGAIRIEDMIFSFSGLPELGDEVLMLLVGQMYGRRDNILLDDHLWEIVKRSNNPYWDERLV